MLKVGDKVILKYDDAIDNQTIVGVIVRIINVRTTGQPNWIDVQDERDMEIYTVRGSDCKLVK
jgi:hypothetical protein